MRVSASVRFVGLLAAIVFVLLLLGLSPGLARASRRERSTSPPRKTQTEALIVGHGTR